MRNGEVSLWYREIGLPARRPPLDGDREADVCIVGGGFTGLWTAYYLKRAQPDLDVVVIDRKFAGFGASGRNGGWLQAAISIKLDALAKRHGSESVMALVGAMRETVREVIDRCREEGIDMDLAEGGVMQLARSAAQERRLKERVEHARQWGFRPEDLAFLDQAAVEERIRVAGARAGVFNPYAVRVQPAKLVTGLAAAAERRGVTIYEGTTATSIGPRRVQTDRGVIGARWVLRCLEGFTASIPGERRSILPLNSAMVATEPLSEDVWKNIGWGGEELLGDAAHAYTYAQRTASGRIAVGGRGVPYRFGSKTDVDGKTQDKTIAQLRAVLWSMFPELKGCPIDHAWCGVVGVPRNWTPSVRLDRATGVGAAGGYVGSGVGTANLAGRTLADLVLDRPSDLTRLPFVDRRSRRWEPEPLRWLGARLVYGLYRTADEREAKSGSAATSVLAKAADLLSGK